MSRSLSYMANQMSIPRPSFINEIINMSNTEVCTPDEDYVFTDSNHSDTLLHGLNELRKHGHFCDVTLCVGAKKFPVHKTVLASFSPYFKTMFLSNLAESQQEFITLNGVDSSMVSLLLDYAYTSTITVTKNNVQSLLSASNLLEVSSVRAACCRLLERHIDSGNCVGIHCFAEAHACHDLARKAKGFFFKNFKKVIALEEWVDLPMDKVVEFLSADDLEVDKEETVFVAASVWLHKDHANRSAIFHKVLECIRLPLVSPYFLVDEVETELAVRTSPECRILVEEARLYHLLPDRRHHIDSPRITPRKNSNTTMAIVAVGGEDNKLVLRSVECFDPVSHGWRSLSCLPFAVSKHGLVVSGDSVLYLSGGEYPDGTVTRCLWKYDSVLDDWHELAPMKSARSELGLAMLDGILFAVGGWDGVRRLSSVECYDRRSNTWSMVSPMQQAITSPAVTSFNGKLYVCGGAILEDGDGMDQVQYYDPRDDTWTTITSMMIPRSGSCACVVGNSIYVIGGWHASTENTNKVERYDFQTKTWTFVACMKERRYRPGVSVVNGKIYILGGEDGWEHFHDSIECYDPANDTWTHVGDMLAGRSWLSCAPLRIKKEVMGEASTTPFS